MDQNRSNLKKVFLHYALPGAALLLLGAIGLRNLSEIHGNRQNTGLIPGKGLVAYLFETYATAWDQIMAKVDHLSKVEEEVQKLRLENTKLKLSVEAAKFECQAKNAEKKTELESEKLAQKTGNEIGRTISSITYKVPEDHSTSQLYILGLSYFKANEDEKAASIFNSLFQRKDAAVYHTPENILMAGVAWYQVQNYASADAYFDEVLRMRPEEETLKYQAQARLWKALVANRQKKPIKEQFWLTELIDHHPHSPEAEWVNRHKEVSSEESAQP